MLSVEYLTQNQSFAIWVDKIAKSFKSFDELASCKASIFKLFPECDWLFFRLQNNVSYLTHDFGKKIGKL